ncbi:hypothetical protein FPCIR_4351 [Fusarium pseudocircinatum]|uniref:Uncharacterized protein n=1 Tax=Fusarium pseudocircinatum TaxID=56676 RepID=A0A8H5UQI0_9HYPO|nr:hypothetical protein FPCIR_4351 [Fusarium pseudocircinatum]
MCLPFGRSQTRYSSGGGGMMGARPVKEVHHHHHGGGRMGGGMGGGRMGGGGMMGGMGGRRRMGGGMGGAETTAKTGWLSRTGTATTMEGTDGLDLHVHARHRDNHCHPLSIDSKCNANNGDWPGAYAIRSNNN